MEKRKNPTLTKLKIAQQQVKTLTRLVDKYEWIKFAWRNKMYRRARIFAFGPQGLKQLFFATHELYLREVYTTTEDIIWETYERLPTIKEMLFVWQEEAERLEAQLDEERRLGRRKYILRTDGPFSKKEENASD